MKWQPNWHRHASSHSSPTLNHNGSGSCNMFPVKHTFRGQSRQVRNQCTRGKCMTYAGQSQHSSLLNQKLSKIKDTHSCDTLSKPTGAPLWTVPRWAGMHCLIHGIKLLTTLDYFASQRCRFEALYENTPNPHWIFRTIQYVLISSPIPLAVHSRRNNMLPAIAESYFKSF